MSETFLGKHQEGQANPSRLQILAIRKINAGYDFIPSSPCGGYQPTGPCWPAN